jgi:hypothetical protein
MTISLKEHAKEVLSLMDELPQSKSDKEFHTAVWSLCQQVIQAADNSDGGQFIPPPLM